MKKFILHTLCFGGLILIVLYAIQFGIDYKAKHTYSILPYRTLNMVKQTHAIDADVVVFGNSRARCHYHSELIDSVLGCSCYNLGLAGYSFDYIYNMVIVPYFEHNISPKLCIVEVGPQAFFGSVNNNYSAHFLPYISEQYSRFYFDICNQISLLDLVFPIKYYATRQTIQDMRLFTNTTLKYKDSFLTKAIGDYHINFGNRLYEVEHNDTIIQYFKDFVAECEVQNIPLLFVCSPMHKHDFYDYCEMEKFWSIINSIAPNVPILDYSLLFGSDTTYFCESTHLNILGADSFSVKLAHDIDSIGFLQ